MKRTSFSSLTVLVAVTLFTSHTLAQGEEPPPPEPPPADQPPPPEPPPTEPPPAEPPPAEPPPAAEPAPATAGITLGASTAPQADTGKKPTQPPAAAAKKEKLVWRGTAFVWDSSATSETVGIGKDIQTRNPTFDMTFSLRPRYYLYDDDAQNVSLRGDVGVFREFTNADDTAKRGEWSFTDTQILGAYSRKLAEDGDYTTLLNLRAPILGLPTSKVSANNGRYLSLGLSAGIGQDLPIQGSKADVFQSLSLAFTAGYSHWFTRATTPTNEDLDRVRMDPEGRSLPGDQLSSSAFAQHQATFTFGADLAVHKRVTWSNAMSWRPSWKYGFDDNVQVCNVATGCVQPERVDDPKTFTVATLFNSEVGVQVIDELDLAVGYSNLTLQLGPDGQRRNIFYSPDARVYLTATAHLDAIYQTATGTKQSAKTSSPTTAARPKQTAWR